MLKVDIGLFAHNESKRIGAPLRSLLKQSAFENDQLSLRLLVLANGCTDDTVQQARAILSDIPQGIDAEVIDLSEGGKSRTWNAFVHSLARPEAESLIFCDADILLPEPDTLTRLINMLANDPTLKAVSSKPVKDIAFDPPTLSLTERLIVSASGDSNQNWHQAICGQLYLLRADTARSFHMPIGLPVEDGFVRAMVLTDLFRQSEDLSCISGSEDVFHIYESERRIGSLIRHQTRIVMGGAINTTLFGYLRDLAPEDRAGALEHAATNDRWLHGTLKDRLPDIRFGWVPGHYLWKRVNQNIRNGAWRSPKRLLLLLCAFGFDALVYVRAQIKMARGHGAGYW